MALGKFKTPMDIISRRLTFLARSRAPSLGIIRSPSFWRHIETPYVKNKFSEVDVQHGFQYTMKVTKKLKFNYTRIMIYSNCVSSLCALIVCYLHSILLSTTFSNNLIDIAEFGNDRISTSIHVLILMFFFHLTKRPWPPPVAHIKCKTSNDK